MTPLPAANQGGKFDPQALLSTIDHGRIVATFTKSKGSLFRGIRLTRCSKSKRGKLGWSVGSKNGNEATVGVLNERDFFGDGCLARQPFRICSGTVMTDCTVVRS